MAIKPTDEELNMTAAAQRDLIRFLLGEIYRPLLRRAIAARLATSIVHTQEHIKALDLFDTAFPGMSQQ